MLEVLLLRREEIGWSEERDERQSAIVVWPTTPSRIGPIL
jgi:hypothetical protein